MEIIEKAPAKINLGLDVLYKREDGYHELEMVMVSVDLSDHLTFSSLEKDEIKIETENSFLPLDMRNHIYKAAIALKEKYHIQQGVHIYLDKKIPVAAGLAGGSSDAAATLRGLNKLWHLGISQEELVALGAEIGSDVPYCVCGNTAFVTGRGETLHFLPTVPQRWVVIVKPRLSVSTGSIFKELPLHSLEHSNVKGLVEAIHQGNFSEMVKNMGNSLEATTITKHPVVAQIKEKMLQFGADTALMSGSGPTVFALCEKYSRAQRIYNGLKGFCDEVYIVRTLNK